jgi:tRNA(Ile)-lysidine synthase
LDRLFPGWDNNLHIHARRLNATVELADRWLDAYGVHGTCFPLKLIDFVSDDLTALILHHWLTTNRVCSSTGQIDQVMRLRDANPGARIIVNDQVTVLRDRDELKLIPTIETRDVSFDVIQITESDLTTQTADFLLDAGSIEIHFRYQDMVSSRTSLVDSENEHAISNPVGKTVMSPNSSLKPSHFAPDELTMDADSIEFPISIRPWQEGDRIQPYGLEGTKLISDILTDKKIASSKKRSAYVITDFDEKICAVIFPHPIANRLTGTIDHDCRITDDTTSKLNIKIRYHT